tara:strand:- start:212 stop:520 length:309 start_codon:yes stop_codon:yes gene_type:complete
MLMILGNKEKNDKANALIYMAKMGHMPFIENEWIYETAYYKEDRKLTKIDELTSKKIFKKIVSYRAIDKMKTFLFSIPYEQRINFIKYFLDISNEKIKNKIH